MSEPHSNLETDRIARLRAALEIPEEIARALVDSCGEGIAPSTSFQSGFGDLQIGDWLDMALRATAEGALPVLHGYFAELAFPVRAGMSQSLDYLRARKSLGTPQLKLPAEPLPEGAGWRIQIHDSGAGLVPVIVSGDRAGFVRLLQTLVYRNEPAEIPASVSASFVNGYPNRVRARKLREAAAGGLLAAHLATPAFFGDCFVLLSPGFYSNTPPEIAGFPADQWKSLSLQIRLEHEACHFVARRFYEGIKLGLRDELLADLCGMMQVLGRFDPALFLWFMGLEACPALRPDGRANHYREMTELEGETKVAFGRLLAKAAHNLAASLSGWTAARWGENRIDLIRRWTACPLDWLATHPDPAGPSGSTTAVPG